MTPTPVHNRPPPRRKQRPGPGFSAGGVLGGPGRPAGVRLARERPAAQA